MSFSFAPPRRPLAAAAANQFGLGGVGNSLSGLFAASNPVITPPPKPSYSGGYAGRPAVPPGSVLRAYLAAGNGSGTNTAPTAPNTYDLSTDPALQQAQAFLGMSDAQAEAAARKAKQQLLLGYGDANLIQSVLGDSNLAKAAAGSGTSTLAQLRNDQTQNQDALTEGLNKSNLLFSGYRVKQEQQAQQNYQNALAKAAADVNQQLGSIDTNLAATEQANQSGYLQSLLAAYEAAMQNPPPVPPTQGGGAAGYPGLAAKPPMLGRSWQWTATTPNAGSQPRR